MFSIYIVVCNAGYYKSGSSCQLCTGNTIKSTIGDASDCDADTSCDGTTKVPNAEHTACGRTAVPSHFNYSLSEINKAVIVHRIRYFIVVCNAGYYKTGSSCELCAGNKTKSVIGDTADCNSETACDGTTKVQNSGHTACGKNVFTGFLIKLD